MAHVAKIAPKAKPWRIEVVHAETGEVVKTMGAMSEREAERVERGVNINIGPDYFTRIKGPKA